MSRLPYGPCPVVLAAPSGTGKTTIARQLVAESEDFVFSVSATTRAAREGERHGVDYEFVSRERFEELVATGELVEWAEVHGHLYGTPRRNVEAPRERGKHVVLDIDVQGAMQLRSAVAEAILIFIFPPSGTALRDRLGGRATEDRDEMERRLRNARREMERAREFDYVVVNDDLEAAVAAVRGIVEAETHRPARLRDAAGEVERLRREIDEVLGEQVAPGR